MLMAMIDLTGRGGMPPVSTFLTLSRCAAPTAFIRSIHGTSKYLLHPNR
jgi:hypothetical protein